MSDHGTAWRDREIADLRAELASAVRVSEARAEQRDEALVKMHQALNEIDRLKGERDTPELKDFLKGVEIEATHQRERWGTDHDGGKSDADWFWLVGYLAGKALHKPEKRLHHLITAAAALYNWHLYTLGKTNMRPGIEPPT